MARIEHTERFRVVCRECGIKETAEARSGSSLRGDESVKIKFTIHIPSGWEKSDDEGSIYCPECSKTLNDHGDADNIQS